MSKIATNFNIAKNMPIFLILLIVFLLQSCSVIQIKEDKITQSYKQSLIAKYEIGNPSGYLSKLVDGEGIQEKKISKEERNQIIYDIMLLINDSYEKYKDKFFISRAQFNILGDMTTLGLDAAVVLLKTPSTKTTLAAIGAALSGVKISYDKHVFQDIGPFAIIQQMEAQRAEVRNQILAKRLKEVGEFTLGEAIIDLREYLRVGTIVVALDNIIQKSGEIISNEKDYKKIIEDAKSYREAMLKIENLKQANADAEVKKASTFIIIHEKGFLDEQKQARIDKLLDKIGTMKDDKAIDLINNLPVKIDEIEKIVKLRDPTNKRKSDPEAAKTLLKMVVVLIEREDSDLDIWEASVQAAQ